MDGTSILNKNSVGSSTETASTSHLQSSQQQLHQEAVAVATTAAANSLQLLLKEDSLLSTLTEQTTNPDAVVFPYAAALLEKSGLSSRQQLYGANQALLDVERRLALVESLAVKLSRTRPEAVAGHLLRLHGYQLESTTGRSSSTSGYKKDEGALVSTKTTTLSAIRDRADRLERQADVLHGIAKRVESSMTRGLDRMQIACTRLERVLTLSSALKSILRLQFESNKLFGFDLEDVRDLTRAAASVAILEELLAQPELQARIDFVDRMRPQIQTTARQVRAAASALLQEQYSKPNDLPKLGSTLQVYYHLGELPDAVWKSVDQAHAKAEAVSRNLFNAVTLVNLTDQAKRTAKEARFIQKKLSQIRAEAATEWSQGMIEVTMQVRNMQRVLTRKTDPMSRQFFVDVVAAAATPPAYAEFKTKEGSSIFSLFWARLCKSLASILVNILAQDQGKYVDDVAALYPPVRASALELIVRLQDTIGGASILEDVSSIPVAGILGGSSVLDDFFLEWSTGQDGIAKGENPQAAADHWTRQSETEVASHQSSQRYLHGLSTTSLSAVFHSYEWHTLQGNTMTESGFFPLQEAFIKASTARLCAPLQYMFPENITVDDDGVPISSGLALLPSKYDVQRFDENIRSELALADPRNGGGDLSLVAMIAGCVVTMVSRFCALAKNALSGKGEDGYVNDDWSMSDYLQHDRKVISIMFTLAKYLRNAPEKTFIAPYRPTISVKHEEAASLCQTTLLPGLRYIEKMVRKTVLNPLCRELNSRIAKVLARMHHGVYVDGPSGGDGESTAFVQKFLSSIFDTIAETHLSRFPPEYAAYMSSKIASFTIYSFVSGASLIRPCGEMARLQITQDLADLELALGQLLMKFSLSISQIDNGKPYAELRSVRQMLFWSGLEDSNRTAQEISKSLLREAWLKDVRPSTVYHYLFSFAPTLLSSPHHTKRVKAEDYVGMLVHLEGTYEDGEDDAAWITTIACCDAYQQRASSQSGNVDGDSRVPQILMLLGQELLRRRQRT
jgi:hypothetical protein